MLDINRGNRMLSLTSTATQSRGLHKYVVELGGEDHPNTKVDFKLGDIVTTVIKCAKGQTIVLSHDTNSPRPYSLNFRVQGTQGLWMKDNRSIYIEGLSPSEHQWESDEAYLKNMTTLCGKNLKTKLLVQVMEVWIFFIVHAFIETLKENQPPVIDVYDAVSMSAIVPLSEKIH